VRLSVRFRVRGVSINKIRLYNVGRERIWSCVAVIARPVSIGSDRFPTDQFRTITGRPGPVQEGRPEHAIMFAVSVIMPSIISC
jgi:hypothetical protein